MDDSSVEVVKSDELSHAFMRAYEKINSNVDWQKLNRDLAFELEFLARACWQNQPGETLFAMLEDIIRKTSVKEHEKGEVKDSIFSVLEPVYNTHVKQYAESSGPVFAVKGFKQASAIRSQPLKEQDKETLLGQCRSLLSLQSGKDYTQNHHFYYANNPTLSIAFTVLDNMVSLAKAPFEDTELLLMLQYIHQACSADTNQEGLAKARAKEIFAKSGGADINTKLPDLNKCENIRIRFLVTIATLDYEQHKHPEKQSGQFYRGIDTDTRRGENKQLALQEFYMGVLTGDSHESILKNMLWAMDNSTAKSHSLAVLNEQFFSCCRLLGSETTMNLGGAFYFSIVGDLLQARSADSFLENTDNTAQIRDFLSLASLICAFPSTFRRGMGVEKAKKLVSKSHGNIFEGTTLVDVLAGKNGKNQIKSANIMLRVVYDLVLEDVLPASVIKPTLATALAYMKKQSQTPHEVALKELCEKLDIKPNDDVIAEENDNSMLARDLLNNFQQFFAGKYNEPLGRTSRAGSDAVTRGRGGSFAHKAATKEEFYLLKLRTAAAKSQDSKALFRYLNFVLHEIAPKISKSVKYATLFEVIAKTHGSFAEKYGYQPIHIEGKEHGAKVRGGSDAVVAEQANLDHEFTDRDFQFQGSPNRKWFDLNERVGAIYELIRKAFKEKHLSFEIMGGDTANALYALLAGFEYGASYATQCKAFENFAECWKKNDLNRIYELVGIVGMIGAAKTEHDIRDSMDVKIKGETQAHLNGFHKEMLKLIEALDAQHKGEQGKQSPAFYARIDDPSKRQGLRYLLGLVRTGASVPMVISAMISVITHSTDKSKTHDILTPAFLKICRAQGLKVVEGDIAVMPETFAAKGEEHTHFIVSLCMASVIMANPQLRPHQGGRSHGNIFVGDTLREMVVSSDAKDDKSAKQVFAELRAMFDLVQQGALPLSCLIQVIHQAAEHSSPKTPEISRRSRASSILQRLKSKDTALKGICELSKRIQKSGLFVAEKDEVVGEPDKSNLSSFVEFLFSDSKKCDMLNEFLMKHGEATYTFYKLKVLLDTPNVSEHALYQLLDEILVKFADKMPNRKGGLRDTIQFQVHAYHETEQRRLQDTAMRTKHVGSVGDGDKSSSEKVEELGGFTKIKRKPLPKVPETTEDDDFLKGRKFQRDSRGKMVEVREDGSRKTRKLPQLPVSATFWAEEQETKDEEAYLGDSWELGDSEEFNALLLEGAVEEGSEEEGSEEHSSSSSSSFG